MANRASVHIQKYLPQHLLSKVFGWLANIQTPWMKNWMIRRFIRKYHVDMSMAMIEKPEDYPDFHHFFIRKLKAELRPFAKDQNLIISPVDGAISQIGQVKKNQLFQAKDFYYNLESLFSSKTLANTFHDGSFATLYLSPRDYHRVHMPFAGKLQQSIYIPGKLFSVNCLATEIIPNLFTRNERLVNIFNTSAGSMAVVMVGAIIVGNIQTVWMDKPVRGSQPKTFIPDKEIFLDKGAELGHFSLGSTVILLFEKGKITWSPELFAESGVKLGEQLGKTVQNSCQN